MNKMKQCSTVVMVIELVRDALVLSILHIQSTYYLLQVC